MVRESVPNLPSAPPLQSCFIPGTYVQVAWDSTSLGYIKSCPRLYYYIMIEGWQSKGENLHLRFGIEYHTAIEQYHKARADGQDHIDALRWSVSQIVERTKDWVVDTDSHIGKYKNRASIIGLVVDYFDKFKDDPVETYIKEDGNAAVELSFRFELDWAPTIAPNQPYLLCGHLDQVVSFNDNLFVMDHKTTKTTLTDYYFNQYSPNNQMTLYTLASQIVIDSPVRGVIIDGAQILLDKPNAFKRGMTLRTPEQLAEWTNDLQYWFRQAEAFAKAQYWPQNDMACGMYGGCKFREVCSKSGSTRKVYLNSDFIKLPLEDKWDPLKQR